jgi:phage terminase Nu1 subunit (DNA packaging protein)
MILNLGELARLKKVSERMVLNWVSEGLPFQRKGGQGRAWEFEKEDAEKWIKNHEENFWADFDWGLDSPDEEIEKPPLKKTGKKR